MSYKRSAPPSNLHAVLENYTVPPLKKLAKLLEPSLPARKAEIIAVIYQHLSDPQRLQQIWESLDNLQQAAVAEIVHSASNHFDPDGFRAKYRQDPNWGELQAYGYGKGKPSQLCLFIHNGFMPPELKDKIKAFVPKPRVTEVETIERPPETIPHTRYNHTSRTRETIQVPLTLCTTERAAQNDLQALLRLIDAGKVRASAKTQRATAASIKNITKVLQGGDFYPPEEKVDRWTTVPHPIKAFAWPLILQNAGLAEIAGSKLQLTRAGQKALSTPPHQTIRRCWDRWQKSTLLDEFNRIHTIKGQTGKGKRNMTAAPGRRVEITAALQDCPSNQWMSFDAFSRYMLAASHSFQVSRDLWTLYISDSNYGNLGYAGYGEWHVVQGRYLMVFLFEYAATLGLLDLAYIHPVGARHDFGDMWGTDDLDCLSRYDGLLYLRINNLGAWCLGQISNYSPSSPQAEPVLKVIPNREIVATAPLPAGDLMALEIFAERISDSVWKIEPKLILKAIEKGRTVSELLDFLVAKADGGIPKNISIFFQEMADRESQLQVRGSALLIEAQDSALAQLITHSSTLARLCMLAGERTIVVPAESEKAFRRALRDLGYSLPKFQ